MNSLAMFQTIMNKLLRNLINTGKVESFINDIIVETESKKKYDELIKKILKRLEKNDLYVKLEKYRWKVKEVDFLDVIRCLDHNNFYFILFYFFWLHNNFLLIFLSFLYEW